MSLFKLNGQTFNSNEGWERLELRTILNGKPLTDDIAKLMVASGEEVDAFEFGAIKHQGRNTTIIYRRKRNEESET